jgi:hypothetical protein
VIAVLPTPAVGTELELPGDVPFEPLKIENVRKVKIKIINKKILP